MASCPRLHPTTTLQAGHSSLPQRRLESDAARRSCSTVAAGAGAAPAAFYLGLCRLRGILSLPAPHNDAAGGLFSFAATKNRIGRGPRCRDSRCRRNHSPLASIPKSRPEIKNHCTQVGVNRQNPAAIPKSGLEIKNRCTQEGLNGEKLTSIL